MGPARMLIGATMGALLLVAGCGSDATSSSTAASQTASSDTVADSTVGVPNPASVYCEEQGGEVVIVTAADGSQSGRCRLPNGTEVDEWEYYRAAQSTTSASTTSATTATGFDVYLQAADVGLNCDQVVAVPRSATVEGPEADALTQLLAGPTPAEQAQGLTSWFSSATSGMLRSVVIEDRVARVDFDPALATTIPNASASCGSSLLLAQLDATIEQFDSADRIVYSLGGDVEAFYSWLQMVAPES